MNRILLIIAVVLLAGCDGSVMSIRNGEVLLDNLAQECAGELTISYRLSSDPEITVQCVQTGPMEGSLTGRGDVE